MSAAAIIAGNPLIEAFGAASQATEKVSVAYFHVFHFFSSHRKELFLLGLRQSQAGLRSLLGSLLRP